MVPTRFFKPDKRIQISRNESGSLGDGSGSGVISLETTMRPLVAGADLRRPSLPLLLPSSSSSLPHRQLGGRARLRRRGVILLFVTSIICSSLCLIVGCTGPVSPPSPPTPKASRHGHLARRRPIGRDWGRRGSGGGGSNFFETFMDEQVAVISPLHLGLDIHQASFMSRDAALAEGAKLSDHLEKLAQRVWLAAEGPDGELLRTSLIESLQLAQISPKDYEQTGEKSERREDDDVDDQDEDDKYPNSPSLSAASSSSRSASSWHQWQEQEEYRRASRDLSANVRDPQLRNLLDVYDMDSFNSNARAQRSPSRGSGVPPNQWVMKELQRRRAKLEERVNATFNGLEPDEQYRFKMATIEAYSLDKLAASECEGDRQLGSSIEDEPGSGRIKRDLTSSSSTSSLTSQTEKESADDTKVCKKVRKEPLILSRLVNRVIEIGMQLFDRLTVTSELLMFMPGLGDKVRAMRAKAEPLIEIVQDLRKTHYLFKVSRCPDSLSEEERDEICTGELRHDASDSSSDDEPTELNVATEMVTKRGAEMLRRLAMFLITDMGLGEKMLQLGSHMLDEITSRTSYALLVWALTSMSSKSAPPGPAPVSTSPLASSASTSSTSVPPFVYDPYTQGVIGVAWAPRIEHL